MEKGVSEYPVRRTKLLLTGDVYKRQAYDYLNANKKKAKKRPVVALIGTGMDVEHEDLKQAIWVNPKEKLNQKDDDKNGWIDDINGWNFIGGKDEMCIRDRR